MKSFSKITFFVAMMVFVWLGGHAASAANPSDTVTTVRRYVTTPEGWYDDLNAAREASRRTNRPMLMLFTGSDWCYWCKQLKSKVLLTPQFTEFSRRNLILVYIDMPQQGLPAEAVNANRQLMQIYRLKGVPNSVIARPDGTVLEVLSGFRADFIQAITEAMHRHGLKTE